MIKKEEWYLQMPMSIASVDDVIECIGNIQLDAWKDGIISGLAQAKEITLKIERTHIQGNLISRAIQDKINSILDTKIIQK